MAERAPSTESDTSQPRRARALEGARRAVAALREKGVTALVTGSLAEGRFRADSDIDLLVTQCPRSLKYAIEGVVEDCLAGFPFDVVYLDEVPARKLSSFLG